MKGGFWRSWSHPCWAKVFWRQGNKLRDAARGWMSRAGLWVLFLGHSEGTEGTLRAVQGLQSQSVCQSYVTGDTFKFPFTEGYQRSLRTLS